MGPHGHVADSSIVRGLLGGGARRLYVWRQGAPRRYGIPPISHWAGTRARIMGSDRLRNSWAGFPDQATTDRLGFSWAITRARRSRMAHLIACVCLRVRFVAVADFARRCTSG